MKYVTILIQFLKGNAADQVGTAKNLLREVVVAVLTATITYIVVHALQPSEPNPVAGLQHVLNTTLTAQRDADSLRALLRIRALRHENDSLKTELRNHAERDSMRANGRLSTVDAMLKINSTINAGKAGLR